MEEPKSTTGHQAEQDEETRLRYECEQALLRMRFSQPSIEEEWERQEARLRAAEQARKRMRRRRRAWGAAIGIAAMATLVILFSWRRETVHGADGIILCEAQPTTAVTVADDSGNRPARTTAIRPGQSPVRQRGAVLSARQADFTQAQPDSAHTTVVTIPRGTVYQIKLSDGTQVWMNADSRLHFPSRFTGTTREVRLEGEAYFRVAKDKSRPFIIRAHGVTTEVLGTEFNLRAYPGTEAHVTLVEGSVRIGMPALGREVTLRPGQDIAYADSGFTITEVDTRYCALWKDGRLYFDNAPLKEILHELGRYYNLTVEMEDDPYLMQTRLHFVADSSETIAHIVENLNLFEYMSVKLDGKKITVTRKN